MNIRRTYPRILLILCTSIAAYTTKVGANETSTITIDQRIKDSFPCVYHLLQDMLSNRQGLFQMPEFQSFFSSNDTRLFISEKVLPVALGAQSGQSHGFENGVFRESIFLNEIYLPRNGSKEYLVSVTIHEMMHAYIKWCSESYHKHRNGIDSLYLKEHFPIDGDTLKYSRSELTESLQHMIMSEDLADIITKATLLYIDSTNLRRPLRDTIAWALTWGGLNHTPKWKKLTGDTCLLHHIDTWSRNMDVILSRRDTSGNCPPGNGAFWTQLALHRPCQ